MNEKKLLELKEQIEDAKQEVNRLEGRQDGLMQQLQKDWKCKSLKEAKKKLGDMKQEIQELQDKIDSGIAELEEKYEFE